MGRSAREVTWPVLRVGAWLLLAGAVLWHGLLPIAGFDIWWQLALGRDIFASGWPAVDTWSHTFAGEPWPYKDGGSAMAYWLLYSAGGVAALTLFKAGAFAGVVAGWVHAARRVAGDSALVPVLSALLVVSVSFRFTIRPQIFSFAALVGVLVVCQRARESAHHSWWPAVGLTWLNALTHRGALLLPLLLAVLAAAVLIDRRRAGERISGSRPVLAVLASALAVVAVPDGWAIVQTSAAMISDPVLHGAIPEWWDATPGNIRLASPMTFVALGVVVAALIFEVRGRRRAYPLTLLLLSIAVGFRGVRFLPYLPLIGLVGAAEVFGGLGVFRTRLAHGCAVAAAGAALAGVVSRPLPAPSLALESGRYPMRSVEFLGHGAGREIAGPLFNDFAFGGYLIFALGEAHPVYIDGRNDIVYTPEFIRTYIEATNDPTALSDLLDRAGIEWVMLATTPDAPVPSAWDTDPRFVPVHVSDVAVIYVRKDGTNAAVAREQGLTLRPLDISRSLLEARANPGRIAATTLEVERMLAMDPDGRYAHVVAARWYSLLGPEGVVQVARNTRWLNEHAPAP